MATPAEQYAFMQELMRIVDADFQALWSLAMGSGDPFAFIIDAYPELAAQYATVAAEMSAVWYEESAPDLRYIAAPATAHALDEYAENAKWALGSGDGLNDPDAARSKLFGSFQRAIWNADRETMVQNAESEGGARWVREAGPGACPFCKMLSTRAVTTGTYYSSREAAGTVVGRGNDMSLSERKARARGESRISGRFIAGGRRPRGSQALGKSYHDACDCRIVAVRPGRDYEPPDHVLRFEQEYIKASRAVPGSGAGSVKDIMAAWRLQDAERSG